MSALLDEIAVEYRPITEVKPRPGNPRTHSEKQVEQLVTSLRQFGFTNPLLVDAEGVLIAGHGRYLAATRMGLTRVPTIQLANLTQEQVRAYVIADNQIALNSGWDMDALAFEVDTLKGLGFDLGVLGFDPKDLDAIIITPEVGDMPSLADGDKSAIEQMTFTLHQEQAAKVRKAMEVAAAMGEYGETGNANRNGNALARVAEKFLEAYP